jgi:acyl carrier protein
MDHQRFFEKLSELLVREQSLTGWETLSELEGWDSVAVISFMAMADSEFGVTVSPKDIAACKTINDIAALVGTTE